jgi:DnaJ family protein C protein 17
VCFANDVNELLVDPLDTTVRIKYNLKTHPNLTTAESIAKLMSSFGRTDTDSIVLSLKPPKKNLDKRPKYGTALVPFKQIGDAFAAVCASGMRERGLDDIEVGWVGGKEPPILVWLKKMGKLGTLPPPATKTRDDKDRTGDRTSAGLPQMQTSADPSMYTSFPSSLVRPLFCNTVSR